jgi:mRNA interferase MazF
MWRDYTRSTLSSAFQEDEREVAVDAASRLTVEYLSRVTVAPITSTIRGVPSEVQLGPEDGMKGACVVNLHNVVTVPQANLGRRLARLGPRRMREVCAALAFAFGCDSR